MRAAAVYCPQTFIDNKNLGHDYKIWFQLDKDICRVQREPVAARSLLQLLVQYLKSFCQKWKVLSAKQKLFSDKKPGCYNLWQDSVSCPGSKLFCAFFDIVHSHKKYSWCFISFFLRLLVAVCDFRYKMFYWCSDLG